MKEIYTDVNIVGGGLIGAALAYSLSKLGLKVSVIEKNPAYNLGKNYKDKRTVAISEGTKQFLDKIDLWKDINKFAEPIKNIKVIDRKILNSLDFDNERRGSNLGYIVKNKKILDILYQNNNKIKNIKTLNNAEIHSIFNHNDKVEILTNNLKINTSLNIAADGKNSFVRGVLKTPLYRKDYKRKALVLTFSHSKDHKNTAYEIFLKNGPLAILPMQKENHNFYSSIVWTNENNYLEALIKENNKKVIEIINEKVYDLIGNILEIESKQIFKISAHINTKFYEKRTIYVGDSAHSIHPIAGQGWNLGMNDISELYKLTVKYKKLGIEIGNTIFCKEYHSSTFNNAYALYQVTDKLDTIFQRDNTAINLLRSVGLKFIQKNKKIKDKISDYAMGF